MKIFEVTPRQPKISKGVENAANNYFRKGNKLYYVEPNDNFGPGENELLKRLKKLG